MTDRRDHMLPGNATALERAMAATTARIDDIPVPIATVLDPANCPAQLLPWLAWQRAVGEWNPAWSEATKREVIARNYKVLAHRGTRASVVQAILAQGFANVQHECWFEYGGQPYRFRLTVLLTGDETWTQDDTDRLIRTVLGNKSVRSKLEALRIDRDAAPAAVSLAAALLIDSDVYYVEPTGELETAPATTRLAATLFITQKIDLEAA